MKEAVRTLAYICPKCRQSVIADRTVFSLCAAHTELPCPCGGSKLEIDPLETEMNLTVPCAYCKKEHRVTVPQRAFLHQKTLAMSCGASGLDCCYVGEEDAVFAAVKRLEEAMDELEPPTGEQQQDQPKEEKQFLNELVMKECLEELRDIAARGGIACQCGSKQWRLRIHYAALQLECAQCGGKLRIPAASQDDLTDLCCRETLEIRENG